MAQSIELLMTVSVTRDTKRFVFTRPTDFDFTPGQGVELAIDQPDWRDEKRPFTPTSLPADRVLEFTIKGYADHDGMTKKLHTLQPGAKLSISEPFGTIAYRGAGVFIAGGAGITPFIAILRELAQAGNLVGHSLIFSNKTAADIICQQELMAYLGERCCFTCTDEPAPGLESRRVDKAFLAEKIDDFGQNFYVCGPPGFNDAAMDALKSLGANPQNLVFEE
ncbi:MAG TPA: FAD-binding oxidoreductase [Rhodocyclaceae bacterium]|nr:FAD-binding oxidoreductase [Rhodocyclaceae bacterium]